MTVTFARDCGVLNVVLEGDAPVVINLIKSGISNLGQSSGR